ncbi:MAG: PAC2 family protein [Chloroflexota bacterium]
MGIILHKEPELENPILIACWPGIGNIGVLAVDTLREMVAAEEFGEIEPWEFFYPRRVVIRNGELTDLQFPRSRFFFKKTESRDLILFVGEEQPTGTGRAYAERSKAYQMASLVLDVALKFGCRRVYTSGAAVAPIHHTSTPRVWAVPNSSHLIKEIRRYENTVLMSDIEGRGGQGSITGLNGLLLGVAKERELEAICMMGEIPVYLQGLPLPYPKASKSVLEVLSAALGIFIETKGMELLAGQTEKEIEVLYESFPLQIREQLDKLRYVTHAEPTDSGPITDEDKKKMLEDIDRFFKKGHGED